MDDRQESRESSTDRVNVADAFRTSQAGSLCFCRHFTRSLDCHAESHIRTDSNRPARHFRDLVFRRRVFSLARGWPQLHISRMSAALETGLREYESAETSGAETRASKRLEMIGRTEELRHRALSRLREKRTIEASAAIGYGVARSETRPCLGNAPAAHRAACRSFSAPKISKLLAVLGPVSSYSMSRVLPTCIIIELPGVLQRFRNQAVSSRWILKPSATQERTIFASCPRTRDAGALLRARVHVHFVINAYAMLRETS